MKENLKYSLFYGAVITLVLTLAYGNWKGFENITVVLIVEIYAFMTLLTMLVTGIVAGSVSKRMEEMEHSLEEEFSEEEEKEEDHPSASS